MIPEIIKNKKQYQIYLNWVDNILDRKPHPHSEAGELLQVILILIKDYEDKHYAIPKPDPIKVLQLKMKEKGLKNKDLVGKLGSRSHISNILHKRKALTLANAKLLYKELGIPAEILLA